MKELKKENGSTQVSLHNLGLLIALHGYVRFMLHQAPIEIVSHATIFGFQDGTLFRATGFTSGPAGNAHTLLDVIRTYLRRRDITIEHINQWHGSRYLLLSGEGSGKRLFHLDDHTEIW